MRISLLVIITILLLSAHASAKSVQDDKKSTVLFSPNWDVNTVVEYKSDIQRTIKQGDFVWNGDYSNIQKLTVKAKSDSGYVVIWQAEGFPVNIFQDFPGPMFDWFQEWSKGKKITLEVGFSNLGVPVSILNLDSVRTFYLNMADEFLNLLPSKELAPLKKDDVMQSLLNLKRIVIPSKAFSQMFLNNLNILFPFYGKTFYQNQDQKITNYKTMPSMSFVVPIEIHTLLKKDSQNIYQLTSTQTPLPFDKWRVKPNGYSSIDFTYSDTLDFKYDTSKQWLNYGMHSMNFERGNLADNFVITYTKVK